MPRYLDDWITVEVPWLMDTNLHRAILLWLAKHNIEYESSWNDTKFFFKSPEDAQLFILRWK